MFLDVLAAAKLAHDEAIGPMTKKYVQDRVARRQVTGRVLLLLYWCSLVARLKTAATSTEEQNDILTKFQNLCYRTAKMLRICTRIWGNKLSTRMDFANTLVPLSHPSKTRGWQTGNTQRTGIQKYRADER